MKVNVKRELAGGFYRISFTITDFSDDERERFTKFGVPTITLTTGQETVTALQRFVVPITGVRPELVVSFKTANAARSYEASVMQELHEKMAALKQMKDDFSGADEVVL